ncbi:hypothetical protein CEXT_95411 [Caerostris extrusa]|uniref:Uncharacterized protein n=1 Tax=Caerostris extrusa TaxID=172846 RepID=A0AAV4UV40_CAEEX|nr:hypothetical protein CEXT_95411 [Caerostris extrusa]
MDGRRPRSFWQIELDVAVVFLNGRRLKKTPFLKSGILKPGSWPAKSQQRKSGVDIFSAGIKFVFRVLPPKWIDGERGVVANCIRRRPRVFLMGDGSLETVANCIGTSLP